MERISAWPNPIPALNGALRKVPPWTLYIVGAAWGAWLFWLGLTGGLGAEPITELEHRYGELAINLLVAGLAVTPLRRYLGLNLMPFRRAIGVLCFFFVLAHLLVWAVLDVQTVARVWADIVERPYVTIGMAGFLLLLPLGLTSNNWSVRKMGAARGGSCTSWSTPPRCWARCTTYGWRRASSWSRFSTWRRSWGCLPCVCARRVARLAVESHGIRRDSPHIWG
jgi:sulfoxide reductase heme-binding subunit YedZ